MLQNLAFTKSWKFQCTVPFKKTRFFGHLWSKIGVFQMKISYLKSSQNLLFSSYTNKYRSDPSKKLVLGPVGQRAAKMWAFKVCTVRDSNPGRSESNDSLCNLWKFFWPPTLTAHNFGTVWARGLNYKISFNNPINVYLEPEAQEDRCTFKGHYVHVNDPYFIS